MANALFDAGRNGFLTGAINWTADTIKVMLVNIGGGGYTVNLATHANVSDVTAGAIVQRSAALTGKSAAAGVANAANVTFPAVTGAVVGAVIIYKDSGAGDATSPLIAYIDTVQGGGALSVTPNGGDITLQWDTGANKIFKL